MIARLRRRHRAWVTVLFIVVTGFFTWAIGARKTIPHLAAPAPGSILPAP